MILTKNAICLSLSLHNGHANSKLQDKPSALKREHPTLQNMKFLNVFCYFCRSFLPSWIRIRKFFERALLKMFFSTTQFWSEFSKKSLSRLELNESVSETLFFIYACISVLDSDPDSTRSADPDSDPDPGGKKLPTKIEKVNKFHIRSALWRPRDK